MKLDRMLDMGFNEDIMQIERFLTQGESSEFTVFRNNASEDQRSGQETFE